jgi:hypothetical protein
MSIGVSGVSVGIEGMGGMGSGGMGMGMGTSGGGGDDEGADEGAGVVNRQEREKEGYQQYVEQYVRISSQMLLKQREGTEGGTGGSRGHRPTRTMGAMLEYFTTLCPITARGSLERCMPNSLLHADLVDISLGRQRKGDKLGTFTHTHHPASASDEPSAEQF